MIGHIDSTYLCQLTAAQIQEILVLNGVSIQQYQPQLHRWLTIAQLPDLGQLILNLEPEQAQQIDLRLQQREIVEFTTMTTVMSIDICDRYVFIPLLEQPDLYSNNQGELWGRICLSGSINSVWTSQDLSWVQALGQQLVSAMNTLAECTAVPEPSTDNLSPLSYLADSIERIGELEAICQKKDEFINNISHDLRAPLTNIKMAMRMLKTSLETDEDFVDLLVGHPVAKYLGILERECDREVELINNILDLQQLELAMLPGGDAVNDRLNLEPLEIRGWLSTTIEPFIYRSNVSHQKLVTSLADDLPTVKTDRIYLTKILTELLNNACKYTHVEGEILVSIDRDPTSNWLIIEVKNQATIAEEHLSRVFEQFYRIPGTNRSQQGTGLGLSLVQKLVNQLKGKINVISSDGWTEFMLKLPIKL